LRDSSPFAHVWKEALAGEAIIERFFHGDSSLDGIVTSSVFTALYLSSS